jgi:glycosyltransferase involved in cell wall biosynthesis
MRILQVSSARSLGGGERHLAALAAGLAQSGHEVFAVLRADSPLRDELSALPTQNFCTLPLRNALDVASALRLARFVAKHNIEIIHAHLARDYTLAAFAARLNPAAALVITRHVLFPLSRVHRFALANAARVITVSESVARALRVGAIFPDDKIRVIPNAVDVQRFERARRNFEDSERDEDSQHEADEGTRLLRVGIVGEISEVKGQEDFVRAASVVAEKFKDEVEFVIVGEDVSRSGEHRVRVERLIAELGLKERVRLMGWLEDVAGVVASLDIFVSASRSEAFGMAMAEALACGVPVVATATEGAREIVEDGVTGLLVPVGDAGALAAAIVSLLKDEPRRLALGAHARESARERFHIERVIAATERVYAEALEVARDARP